MWLKHVNSSRCIVTWTDMQFKVSENVPNYYIRGLEETPCVLNRPGPMEVWFGLVCVV